MVFGTIPSELMVTCERRTNRAVLYHSSGLQRFNSHARSTNGTIVQMTGTPYWTTRDAQIGPDGPEQGAHCRVDEE